MKFYKVTLHKDLRDVDGIDVFAKYGVYWFSVRCTARFDLTAVIFGDDSNIKAFMDEYGHRANMTIHNGAEMTASDVVSALRGKGLKTYPYKLTKV